MDKTIIIVIAGALVAVAAIVAAFWMFLRRQQTSRLQSRFGPEYDRLAAAEGDRGLDPVLNRPILLIDQHEKARRRE